MARFQDDDDKKRISDVLSRTSGSFVGNVGSLFSSAIGGFVKKQSDNIGSLASGETTVREVLNEVPKATAQVSKTVGNLAADIVRAPVRFSTSGFLSLGEYATGREQSVELKTKTEKLIFGVDEVRSFQKSSDIGAETVEALGGDTGAQKYLPPALIAFGGVLDLSGFGKPVKSGLKPVVDGLAQETNETAIKSTLRENARALDTETVERIAPAIAKADNARDVESILDTAYTNRMSNSTLDEIATDMSPKARNTIRDDVPSNVVDEALDRSTSAKTRTFDISNPTVKNQFDALPDDLDSSLRQIAQDVKNFKTEDAFISQVLKEKNGKNYSYYIAEARKNDSTFKRAVATEAKLSQRIQKLEKQFRSRASEITNGLGANKLKALKLKDPKYANDATLKAIDADYQKAQRQFKVAQQKTKAASDRVNKEFTKHLGSFENNDLEPAMRAFYQRFKQSKQPEAQSRSAKPLPEESGSEAAVSNAGVNSPLQDKVITLDESIVTRNAGENVSINTPTGGFFDTKLKTLKNTEPYLRSQEWLQDNWIRVKRVMEKEGVKFTDESNPYQKQQLFHGIVGALNEDLDIRVRGIETDIVKLAKKRKIDATDFRSDVNSFLHARHATERNAALQDGAAGITDADAAVVIDTINAKEYGEEVVDIANRLQEMNDEVLDILLDGDIISRELYDTLRDKYKTHVPLNRVMDDDGDQAFADILATRGLNVKGSTIKAAVGSDREVRDIAGNIVANYKQAIERAEKNKVNISTYNLAKENGMFGGLFAEPKIPMAKVATEPVEKVIDPVLDSKLRAFAAKIGVAVEDVKSMSAGGKQALGKAIISDKENKIKLRVASDSHTFAHELGHMIDLKLNKIGDDALKPFDNELSKIALRRAAKETIDADPEFKKYLLNREEKVAEAISMFINNRDEMAKIAPKAHAYFKETFEGDDLLKDIIDMKPSRQREITTVDQDIYRPNYGAFDGDEMVLKFRVGGEQKYLQINDAKLARAFSSVNVEQIPSMLRPIGVITRFYAGMATRFNPEFAFSNIIRDTQDLVVNSASMQGGKAAVKNAGNVPKSVADINMWLAGKETKGSKLYEQMRQDGGTTGGLGLSTRDQIDVDIETVIKDANSNPRKVFKTLIRSVDNYNRVFEDATRLSAYKTALDQGKTRDQAAFIAKNVTVNFNNRGTASPIINSLWMFTNASVQGNVRTIKSLANPKTAAVVFATVMGITEIAQSRNDSIDPDWREKISDYDRVHSLVFVTPGQKDDEFSYVTIPVSWGLKPMKVMSDRLYEIRHGKGEAGQAAADIASSLIESYNPIGGTDFFSTLTPTVLDVPAEIARNKAWHGGVIFPDWKQGLPAPEQTFNSTDETLKGKTSIQISEMLNNVGMEITPPALSYIYDQFVGGAGRAVTRMADTVGALATGSAPDANPKDLFLINRFLKVKEGEQVERSIRGKNEDQLFDDLKDERDAFERKDIMRDYLRGMEQEDAQRALFILRDKGFDTKGVTYSDNPRKPKITRDEVTRERVYPTYDDWYAYYRSPKFNHTRAEADEMAKGMTKGQKAPIIRSEGSSTSAERKDEIRAKLGL